ncbi:hypothetical protein B0T20DRAFT_392359 [Sordaria brevicollis]|uniref:Uncharacterized protein n=1 Tax=Sordaria brevicollis TaxID=83679 RepID=A0AAE0PG78_SORBR|nr:hypothetical protein B0T20DRAFT_392359 [Sordaria brevicollis]
MSQRRPSSNTRRSRSRPNQQPRTLRREDAMVVYEFNGNSNGHHQTENSQARRTAHVLQFRNQGLVNGQPRSNELQVPTYTQNPGSHEMTTGWNPRQLRIFKHTGMRKRPTAKALPRKILSHESKTADGQSPREFNWCVQEDKKYKGRCGGEYFKGPTVALKNVLR